MAELPVIDYDSSKTPQTFLGLTGAHWLTAICIAAVLMLLILTTLPMLGVRKPVPYIPCASHLRQIGQAIHLYAQDNAGQYPPDLPTVLRTQETLGTEVFICPTTSDAPAKGDSPQQRAAQLLNGHCSYVYVGRHFTIGTNPECIVAFEDPANHGLDGANVLYADGHVEYQADVPTFISELEQGFNPPRQIAQSVQQAEAIYQRDWVPKLQSIKSGQWSASLPTTRPTTRNAR